MDYVVIDGYYSGMTDAHSIPLFNLFGETTVFPDVVHCERVLDRAGLHDWVIAPHRHSHMSQVFYIEHGSAHVMLDGTETRLDSGRYLYVPPQIVHRFEFIRGTEGIVLSLPSPVVSRLGPKATALTSWLSASQQGVVTGDVAQLIAALAATYTSTGTFRAQRLVALAHVLLATLAENDLADVASEDPRAGRQIQRLDALIAKHLTDGWAGRDYAAALHITTGHLNRIVRMATGCSLSAHLETATMTEACRLIAFTRLPMAEIGYRLGFSDPSYFSRRFRVRMGEAPSEYRMRVLGLEL